MLEKEERGRILKLVKSSRMDIAGLARFLARPRKSQKMTFILPSSRLVQKTVSVQRSKRGD